MKKDIHYLTQEKFNELEAELNELTSKKRKEIAENLEYAKALGDLSENAEYHEAREAQMNLEERIAKVENILKNSSIISANAKNDKVGIGATVKLSKGSGDPILYTIVGTEEANIAENKLSISSPLAEAMIGKKKGESFTFSTPKGKVSYKVLDVE